jgi:HSP20 family protein
MTKPSDVPVKTEKTAPAEPAGIWAPLENLRHEIDHVFDSFNTGGWRLPFTHSLRKLEAGLGVSPAVDVAEKDAAFEITAELPGMDQNDIEVKFANGTLTIKGEKRAEREEHQKDCYVSERSYGSFMRSFRLPDGIDTGKIEATFAKGVLKVALPKSVEAQKSEQRIEIKAA